MKPLNFPSWYYENKNKFWNNISPQKWNDWHWQLNNQVNSAFKLKEFFPDENIEDLNKISSIYPFGITPYFLCLMNLNDIKDPVALQVKPSLPELADYSYLTNDPFKEKEKTPVNGVIKRYPDRVVVILSNKCPSYCRYCTRKWMWNSNYTFNREILETILNYLTKKSEIREVILSGGEPFLMNDNLLEEIIKKILIIPHIEVIRIGTRILSFMPQRITKSLTRILSKYKPIWLVTHFNHPQEITPLSEEAIDKLIKAGIALCNQSVLLKNINDNIDTMKSLLHKLEFVRVKPYYLFQCDLVNGTHHFRTSINKGKEIMQKLQGNTGGVCIPTYVIDMPEGGKVPILPEYMVEANKDFFKLRNYEGKIFKYPNL